MSANVTIDKRLVKRPTKLVGIPATKKRCTVLSKEYVARRRRQRIVELFRERYVYRPRFEDDDEDEHEYEGRRCGSKDRAKRCPTQMGQVSARG